MSEAPKHPDKDSKSQTSSTYRQHQDPKGSGAPLKTCRNCGMTWKWLHYCPAENKTCNSCNKIGHFARMCRFSSHNNNNDNRNPRRNNNMYKNNDNVDTESTGSYNGKKMGFNRGNNRKQSQDYRNDRGNENNANNSPSESPSHENKNDDNYSRRNNRRQNHDNLGEENFQEFKSRRGDRRDGKQSETPRDPKDSSYNEKTENFDRNSEDNGNNSGNSKSDSWGQKKFQGKKFNRQNNRRKSKTNRHGKSDNNEKNYKNDCNEDCGVPRENETDDKKNYCESENFGDSRQESRYAYTNVGQARYNPGKDKSDKDDNAKPSNFSKNNDYSKFNGGGNTSTPGYYSQEQKKYDTIGLKQRLAKSFYQQGNYEAALSHYSRLIEMCPKDPVNFSNRSACYMMMGQYENAATDANKSVQLDPSCVKGYSRMIKCAILLGDTMSAELNLTKLSQMYPNYEIIAIERKKLNELQEHSKREMIAMRSKNYQSALECINKCLLISPHCLSYNTKKAEYLVLLKRHNEAQQVLNEVLLKDPINVDAKYIMGIRLYHSDIDEALKYFTDILRLDPENSKCLQMYKKAKKIMTAKAQGNQAFISGAFFRAHAIYSTAISIDPDNNPIKAKLSYNMGQASYNMRNYGRAIEEYSQALEIDPDFIKALKQRGKCYMEMKDYEEVIADFSRVCSLEPNSEFKKLINDAEKLLASVNQDFYTILGVSRDPSIEEVKKAYKDKAMLHHPDRHSNATIEQQKKHERKFKDITLAYRDLLEKCKRKLASR